MRRLDNAHRTGLQTLELCLDADIQHAINPAHRKPAKPQNNRQGQGCGERKPGTAQQIFTAAVTAPDFNRLADTPDVTLGERLALDFFHAGIGVVNSQQDLFTCGDPGPALDLCGCDRCGRQVAIRSERFDSIPDQRRTAMGGICWNAAHMK
jgi:hypothetical protein